MKSTKLIFSILLWWVQSVEVSSQLQGMSRRNKNSIFERRNNTTGHLAVSPLSIRMSKHLRQIESESERNKQKPATLINQNNMTKRNNLEKNNKNTRSHRYLSEVDETSKKITLEEVSNSNYATNLKNPHSCSCEWTTNICGCDCSGTLSSEDFQALSKYFRPCSKFSFAIHDGSYRSLPSNLFSQVGHVHEFHLIISNATFDYLFDSTPKSSAFRGVTFENEAVIKISNVKVRQTWNWTPLEQLKSSSSKARTLIEIDGCGLKRLSSDFSKAAGGAVKDIVISDSNLEIVGSGAFSMFSDLEYFRLPRNKLRSIKRTDLPLFPKDLTEIDLRYNNINSLESDFFMDMPSIRFVWLAGNPLPALADESFKSIIGRAYLPELANFPLYCDCRLKWLKDPTFVNNTIALRNLNGAICRRPPHLRGTPLADLSKEHLKCL